MEGRDKRITDLRERERALDIMHSFIVQAPAGSGKTELLMQRYLTLLAVVEKPEEILALTFTNKAAGEMQGRIMDSLTKAADGNKGAKAHEQKTLELAALVLARDNEKGWNLIENPSRLKVQTLDSFNSSLVRQMPMLSRLGRKPAISETPYELYAEAARRTIEMVEGTGAGADSVLSALAHMDNSVAMLSTRLVAMLATREQWLRHIKSVPEDAALRDRLEGSLKKLVEKRLASVRSSMPAGVVERLTGLAWYAAANVDELSPIHALSELDGLPGASVDDLALWKGIRELLLTGKNALRKPRGVNKRIGFPAERTPEALRAKEDFKELLTSLELEPELTEVLKTVQGIAYPTYSDTEWEILASLVHLLPIADEHLGRVFASQGCVDFVAVSMAALDSLGTDSEPTDLMLALDMKVQHILVDEYQDTSHAQLSLLTALTRGWEEGDGRTLFIVGDPMQSIYLFREAEVGLFLDAAEGGIGCVWPVRLRLESNFRSHPGIVSWVNGSFAGAFPGPGGEDAFTGAIAYSESVPVIDASSGAGGGGGAGVDISLYSGRDDAAEAERVVSLVKGAGPDETVGVLCRSRSHLYEIMGALEREGVDFRAEQMEKLIDRPVIQDLFSLLRAVVHPFDRVAWLALLRAPWCGVTLADLVRLCTGDKESALWELLNDSARIGRLSDDGKRRAGLVTGVLGRAMAALGRGEISSLLESVWVELGGPACVDDASMRDAATFFDVVRSLSSQKSTISTEELSTRLTKLFADSGGSSEANVDLMTIHRAKGLEFDRVIIPGAGRPPRGEQRKLLVWMDWKDDLFLAPVEKKAAKAENPIYNYLRSIGAERGELERVRVFYVACTRARKNLHILGHAESSTGEDAQETIAPDKRSFLWLIRHVLDAEMFVDRVGEPGGAGVDMPLIAAASPLRPKRLSPDWKSPAPVALARVGVLPVAATIALEPEFDWAGYTARHIGTVVHAYLCRIALVGLERWDEGRVRSESDVIEGSLRSLGISRVDAAKAVGRCVELLTSALADPLGRWVLDTHTGGEVERPVTGLIDGDIIHAVIDRTFVAEADGNTVRWIIDYKTGSHKGSPEEFLKSERARYSPQLERYAQLLRGEGETREIKKGLYFPALKRLEVL